MWPVQTHIPIAELFRENDHIAEVRLGDQRNTFHFFKIPGARQGNPHAVTGIGAIGQQVLVFYQGNPNVFDSERFIFGKNIVR